MPLGTRVILVLHPDHRVHAVVRDAARHAVVSALDDWQALHKALLVTPPSTVGVVDPYFASQEPGPSPELHALLMRVPSASLIPALEITPESASDLALLDAWGTAGFISTGHDDTPAAIASRLADACLLPLKRLLAATLPADASPNAYTLLFAAADAICHGGNATDLATALQASPSTLLRWCEEAGLPTPRTLLQWVRVLLATCLLAEPARTPDAVARACGYASRAELRRVTQRLLGQTPVQLRSDGFAHASACFLRSLPLPR